MVGEKFFSFHKLKNPGQAESPLWQRDSGCDEVRPPDCSAGGDRVADLRGQTGSFFLLLGAAGPVALGARLPWQLGNPILRPLASSCHRSSSGRPRATTGGALAAAGPPRSRCVPAPRVRGGGVAAGRPTCREWGMPDDDGPQAPRGSPAPSRFGPVCLEAGLPQLPAPQERGLGQRRRGTRETPLSVLTAAAARLWSATISQRGRRSRSAPAAPRAGLVRAALAALRPGVAIRRAGGGGQSCWAGALLSRGGGRE